MKEVKLSEVAKTPVGELRLRDIQMARVTGTKDLHPIAVFGGVDELLCMFRNKEIELYVAVEDEEYLLVNDIENDY